MKDRNGRWATRLVAFERALDRVLGFLNGRPEDELVLVSHRRAIAAAWLPFLFALAALVAALADFSLRQFALVLAVLLVPLWLIRVIPVTDRLIADVELCTAKGRHVHFKIIGASQERLMRKVARRIEDSLELRNDATLAASLLAWLLSCHASDCSAAQQLDFEIAPHGDLLAQVRVQVARNGAVDQA